MLANANGTKSALLASFAAAKKGGTPYPHWFLEDCLSQKAVDEILALPFPAPSLEGVSGKRELHNGTRKYFDTENQEKFPFVAEVAEAFQDAQVTNAIEKTFGAPLKGSYLRIEFAQDIDGFWLEPHTDIGVKVFTFLIYLSRDKAHAGLGTDIYNADKKWVGRSPFVPGGGMIFVPSMITYHGFDPRPIEGVRKSLIVNYVTNDWRAREQLSFPQNPIAA
jgi:hypothetical protein